MQILHLSDINSKHRSLKNMQPAKIIIHSGDVSFAGSENEIMDSSENINYGNRNLLQTALSVKPHYHLFGHIHAAYGIKNA